MTDRFERFSNETSQSLSDRIGALDSDVSQTVDAFLTEFFRKLTAGEIRLVLVLDYASRRLKSSVEFINEQLERIDFNLVNQWHARNGDQILIAPQLFGYSERTRNIKRLAIERAVVCATREWDEGTFLEALAKRPTSESASRAVQEFLQRLPQLGFSIDWGRGLTVGLLGPAWTGRVSAPARAGGNGWKVSSTRVQPPRPTASQVPGVDRANATGSVP